MCRSMLGHGRCWGTEALSRKRGIHSIWREVGFVKREHPLQKVGG